MKKLSVLLLAAALVGCAQEEVIVPAKEANKEFDRFEFRSELSRKEVASVGDLVRLVSQSYKSHREKYSLKQWYAAFVKLGWISSDLDMNAPCTRGQVGRIVAGRLDLKGNLFLIVGPSERYGFREIMRLNFLSRGYPSENIAGSTLMNVQSKATAWTKKSQELKDAYDRHTEEELKEVFGES